MMRRSISTSATGHVDVAQPPGNGIRTQCVRATTTAPTMPTNPDTKPTNPATNLAATTEGMRRRR